MADLRAGYKERLDQAARSENDFICTQCQACEINTMPGHRTERNYCTFFRHAKAALEQGPFGFYILYRDAGCDLID